jgi:hypothetical protein
MILPLALLPANRENPPAVQKEKWDGVEFLLDMSSNSGSDCGDPMQS